VRAPELGDGELLTIADGFDVGRKAWGWYATPSLNARAREHGLRGVLAMGQPRPGKSAERMYVMLVEEGREAAFEEYLAEERMRIVAWLDSDEAVAEAERALANLRPR
jgi:hypothetical protein